MIDYYKDIFVSSSTFFQVKKVHRDKFKWVSRCDWLKGCSCLSARFLLLHTGASPQHIMLNVSLHVGPKEAVSNQTCGPINTLVPHFVMQFLKCNFPEFCRQYKLSSLCCFPSQNTILIQNQLIPPSHHPLAAEPTYLNCLEEGFTPDCKWWIMNSMSLSSLWALMISSFGRGLADVVLVSAHVGEFWQATAKDHGIPDSSWTSIICIIAPIESDESSTVYSGMFFLRVLSVWIMHQHQCFPFQADTE